MWRRGHVLNDSLVGPDRSWLWGLRVLPGLSGNPVFGGGCCIAGQSSQPRLMKHPLGAARENCETRSLAVVHLFV